MTEKRPPEVLLVEPKATVRGEITRLAGHNVEFCFARDEADAFFIALKSPRLSVIIFTNRPERWGLHDTLQLFREHTATSHMKLLIATDCVTDDIRRYAHGYVTTCAGDWQSVWNAARQLLSQ